MVINHKKFNNNINDNNNNNDDKDQSYQSEIR